MPVLESPLSSEAQDFFLSVLRKSYELDKDIPQFLQQSGPLAGHHLLLLASNGLHSPMQCTIEVCSSILRHWSLSTYFSGPCELELSQSLVRALSALYKSARWVAAESLCLKSWNNPPLATLIATLAEMVFRGVLETVPAPEWANGMRNASGTTTPVLVRDFLPFGHVVLSPDDASRTLAGDLKCGLVSSPIEILDLVPAGDRSYLGTLEIALSSSSVEVLETALHKLSALRWLPEHLWPILQSKLAWGPPSPLYAIYCCLISADKARAGALIRANAKSILKLPTFVARNILGLIFSEYRDDQELLQELGKEFSVEYLFNHAMADVYYLILHRRSYGSTRMSIPGYAFGSSKVSMHYGIGAVLPLALKSDVPQARKSAAEILRLFGLLMAGHGGALYRAADDEEPAVREAVTSTIAVLDPGTDPEFREFKSAFFSSRAKGNNSLASTRLWEDEWLRNKLLIYLKSLLKGHPRIGVPERLLDEFYLHIVVKVQSNRFDFCVDEHVTLLSYLKTGLKRWLIDWRKKRARKRKGANYPLNFIEDRHSLLLSRNRQASDLLDSLMDQVCSEKEKEVLRQHLLGNDMETIAGALGISASAAYKRYERAMPKLAAAAAKY